MPVYQIDQTPSIQSAYNLWWSRHYHPLAPKLDLSAQTITPISSVYYDTNARVFCIWVNDGVTTHNVPSWILEPDPAPFYLFRITHADEPTMNKEYTCQLIQSNTYGLESILTQPDFVKLDIVTETRHIHIEIVQ